MFKDRKEAGRLLAEKLSEYRGKNILVLAIPRGGVVVAAEVAEKLGTGLDLVIPRKIGSPDDQEYAIGAVAPDRSIIIDKEAAKQTGATEEYIDSAAKIESVEITRRMKKYRGSSEFPDVEGKNVVLVDDGIATGYTVKVVVDFLKKMKPKSIVVAVPVAPEGWEKRIGKNADEFVCLDVPQNFSAIGSFYEKFSQVSDDEVIKIMKKFRGA